MKGSMRVETSEVGISSVDLVLHRVEKTPDLVKPQKSDVGGNTSI